MWIMYTMCVLLLLSLLLLLLLFVAFVVRTCWLWIMVAHAFAQYDNERLMCAFVVDSSCQRKTMTATTTASLVVVDSLCQS
jgi:hypothetical protein